MRRRGRPASLAIVGFAILICSPGCVFGPYRDALPLPWQDAPAPAPVASEQPAVAPASLGVPRSEGAGTGFEEPLARAAPPATGEAEPDGAAEPGGDGTAEEAVAAAGEAAPLGWPLEENVEPPPLAEQSEAWWARAWSWLPRDRWNNSAQLGINGTEGNSQTFSFQSGLDLKRKTDRYDFALELDYQKTQAAGVETQNNAFLGTNFDRMLGDTRWSAFSKLGLEYDRFKAFDLRLNGNAGFGYYWIREEATSLVTRVGAGTSREFGGPDNDWQPEAMFGIEAEQQITDRQKANAKIEYMPQWDRFADYRLVSEVGWEVLLNEAETLSMKIAATERYDSTPQGRKPGDLNYSLLLLYRF